MFPNPVLVCSLTRAAAAEVAGRDLPVGRSQVGTLHAHCYRALGHPKVVESASVAEWNEAHPDLAMNGSSFGDDEDSTVWERSFDGPMESAGDALLARMDILRHRLTPVDRWPEEIRIFRESWDSFKQEHGLNDFTDLIERAMVETYTAPGNPAVILVDEAQDLSTLEYSLVRRWGEQAQAVIVVGDPWQVLYAWRGADPSLFDDATIHESHRRVLGQSYRVPHRVLACSVAWIRDHLSTYKPIVYKPRVGADLDDDPMGMVSILNDATVYRPEPMIDEAILAMETGRSVMIQVSCSYMLRTILGRLRHMGVPFANPWRSSRGDWNPISSSTRNKTMSKRLVSLLKTHPTMGEDRGEWTCRDIHLIAEHLQIAGNLLRGAKASIERAAKSAESADRPPTDEQMLEWFTMEFDGFLQAVSTGSWEPTKCAWWWLRRLLGKQQKTGEFACEILERMGVSALLEDPRLFVGTIHSFKGAEADCVYLFPDLSPAAYREWQNAGEVRDSVVRLFYVAMTRAREKLTICAPQDIHCAPVRRFVQEIIQSGEIDLPVDEIARIRTRPA
jgi:DNA helicase-2/ATP-dependent DNA helicase PcrA